MDKIGTLEFDAMSGQPGGYAFVSESLSRPGIDGDDPRIIGKRGDEFIMTTIAFFSDLELARAAIRQYESMAAKNYQMIYAGVAYSVFVIWSRFSGPHQIISSDNSKTHMVSTEWTMRRTK